MGIDARPQTLRGLGYQLCLGHSLDFEVECTLVGVQGVKAVVFSADNVFSTLDLQLECHAVQLDCNILSKLIIDPIDCVMASIRHR
jgi:hypothetical protein